MARFCSHCGQRGHNRRTCPHLSEERKQAEKTWHRKPGPRSGSKSICSYCGETGHNRRTCWHLKHRLGQAEGFIESAVAFALQQYQFHGLGSGALYERLDSWMETKATYLITDGVSVSYSEQIMRQADGQLDKDHKLVPTLCFTVMGKKLYGDRNVERDIGPTVKIHNDLLNKRPVSNTRCLREFCEERRHEKNKIVGKADHPFPEAMVQRLREWAHREVKEFFRNKENRHPKFGDYDALSYIRAEAEAQEKMRG